MISNEVNLKVYDINNFYVGELLLIQNIADMDFSNKLKLKKKLLINGAVNLTDNNKNLADYIDWEQGKKIYKVITIFYKEKDNYLCLHDGNFYKNTEEIKCLNLVELTKLLPKISYNCPKKITINQALIMFKVLFDKTYKLIDVYNERKYKITDFYVGKLIIPTKFTDNETKQKHQCNIYERCILEKKSRLIGFFSNSNKEIESTPSRIGRYQYDVYECLVLKLPDNSLYNINNFHIYKNQDKIYNSFSERPIGESYYENLTPINEMLNMSITTKLSIPKVLSKQQKF